ncbi:hypothetical protein AN641_07610 [Candidatus Epulonipiscioides gigas]|nr:hypothetical protein AN641_07610 [Epulopiscium sp. SCG-C07WGA-EpuloA2]
MQNKQSLAELRKAKIEKLRMLEKAYQIKTKKRQLEEIQKSILEWKNIIQTEGKLKIEIVDKEVNYITKISVWEGLQIIIEMPLSKPLYTNHIYTINFSTSNDILLANVIPIKSIPKGANIFYVLELISPVHKKQHRNYFRLETKIALNIILPIPLEELTEKDTVINVNTLDISAGGVRFLSKEIIENDTIVKINFNLQNNDYKLKGKILTHFEEKTKGEGHIYRVAFIDIDNNMQEKLFHDILSYQRVLLKQNADARREEAKNRKKQIKQ